MANKRKLAEPHSARSRKRSKFQPEKATVRGALPEVHHSVLSLCYAKVYTLRVFLLTNLPPTSRVRRKRLSSTTLDDGNPILDTCLVGILNEPSMAVKQSRTRDLAAFTQSQGRGTAGPSGKGQSSCMEEVG